MVHDEKYMINFIEESLKSGDLEEIQQLLCRYKEKFVRKDYWTGISIVDRVITMEKRKMDELVHRPFNKYHIKQMQTQSLQYHPFCISSGKQPVPC